MQPRDFVELKIRAIFFSYEKCKTQYRLKLSSVVCMVANKQLSDFSGKNCYSLTKLQVQYQFLMHAYFFNLLHCTLQRNETKSSFNVAGCSENPQKCKIIPLICATSKWMEWNGSTNRASSSYLERKNERKIRFKNDIYWVFLCLNFQLLSFNLMGESCTNFVLLVAAFSLFR